MNTEQVRVLTGVDRCWPVLRVTTNYLKVKGLTDEVLVFFDDRSEADTQRALDEAAKVADAMRSPDRQGPPKKARISVWRTLPPPHTVPEIGWFPPL